MIKDTIGHSLAIYIPKPVQEQKPIERLNRLAKRMDRSVNYLIVQAILAYLQANKA